jgi:hypothetical protein
MACLLAEDTSEALVLVLFESADEVFMSEANLQKLKALLWQKLAKPLESGTSASPA